MRDHDRFFNLQFAMANFQFSIFFDVRLPLFHDDSEADVIGARGGRQALAGGGPA